MPPLLHIESQSYANRISFATCLQSDSNIRRNDSRRDSKMVKMLDVLLHLSLLPYK